MAQWATFVGVTFVVLILLLALARVSQTYVTEPADPGPRAGSEDADGNGTEDRAAVDAGEFADSLDPAADGVEREPDTPETASERSIRGNGQPPAGHGAATSLDTGVLLANVALSQGLFAAVLVAAAWYAQIPPWALGIGRGPMTGLEALGAGIGIGLALYALTEVGGAITERVGFERNDELREVLAPETAGGWVALLLGVLPIIAAFEEFLFRAALIGAVAAGYGVSPWLLAVLSSAAFALGHGAQGGAGIVVTGALGLLLAAAFVLTGSLLAVIVAHYVINALEFVVHEGLGIEWAR